MLSQGYSNFVLIGNYSIILFQATFLILVSMSILIPPPWHIGVGERGREG